jgi:anti-sigma factor RsiW
VTCAQIHNLLHAFLDGELDLVRHLEIEHHLGECTACAEEHAGLRGLGAALKTDGLYFRAPPGLPQRVRDSLRDATGEVRGVPRDAQSTSASPRIAWRRLGMGFGLAASSLLFIGGAAFLLSSFHRLGSPAEDPVAQEAVNSHIRSLLAEHLTDIGSSDRHTVKPWFKGKVDFAPTVCDLAEEGFPLVGGRLDYLDGHTVAVLVYRRRQHVINLLQWPAAESPARGPVTTTRKGFHLVHWIGGGMSWWAVSDLNPDELREFAELVIKEIHPAVR